MSFLESMHDTRFVPRRRLASGHWMTIFCWAARRRFQLPPPERRLFQVTPDTQVVADCYWQPDRATRLTVLALHGLEGSSEAHYMRGLAEKALRAGFNAILLNQRNCGGTEHLGPGLYHSGLVDDAAKTLLLKTYWTIPERQIETSVVLANPPLDDA